MGGVGLRQGRPPQAELGWFAETAVNIGFACELLSGNMIILEEKEIVQVGMGWMILARMGVQG